MPPKKPSGTAQKIYARDKLRAFLSRRRRGKKIVFTNGCFDLLHPGHIQTLESAKAKGDLLIVALNEDESVRRLKGPARPVNTVADRSRVMAALECVDFVTSFGEDTPLELIEELRPDILVKGGDYDIDQVVGAREVRSWGGKVAVIPLVPQKSTTAILARSVK